MHTFKFFFMFFLITDLYAVTGVAKKEVHKPGRKPKTHLRLTRNATPEERISAFADKAVTNKHNPERHIFSPDNGPELKRVEALIPAYFYYAGPSERDSFSIYEQTLLGKKSTERDKRADIINYFGSIIILGAAAETNPTTAISVKRSLVLAEKFINMHPVFLLYTVENLHEKMTALRDLGFSFNEILYMLNINPNLIGMSAESYKDNVRVMLDLGIPIEHIQYYISTNPIILACNLSKNIPLFLEIGFTKEEVVELFKLAPSVFGMSFSQNIRPTISELQSPFWSFEMDFIKQNPWLITSSLSRIQDVRATITKLAKIAGTNDFTLGRLTAEERRSIVLHVSTAALLSVLKAKGVFKRDRTSLARLTEIETGRLEALLNDGRIYEILQEVSLLGDNTRLGAKTPCKEQATGVPSIVRNYLSASRSRPRLGY